MSHLPNLRAFFTLFHICPNLRYVRSLSNEHNILQAYLKWNFWSSLLSKVLTEQESFELESTKSHIMFPIADKRRKRQMIKMRHGIVGRLTAMYVGNAGCLQWSGPAWKFGETLLMTFWKFGWWYWCWYCWRCWGWCWVRAPGGQEEAVGPAFPLARAISSNKCPL